MSTYQAPLRDIRFVFDALGAEAQWAEMPHFAELDADTAASIVEEGGRFAAEVLAPIDGPGDLEGCRWSDGEVTTPAGYAAAYRAFVEGGWPALVGPPAYGGQGLPQLLNAAIYEMLDAACHAWTMYPGLAHGACECIAAHASPELRERYLPRLVCGEWLATMALTEPQAGSDLGLLRTRAEPQGDGSVRVTGSKIFISGGEHDLSDNIVHLVLCRLPGAPAGSKGLSLALVPKLLPDGRRNAVRCDGIEKKMGIKGSATCALSFEGATGWLIGEANRGLAAMFVMMNAARLGVGVQGLAHLEACAQLATAYALERRQMRSAARPAGQQPSAADPIAWHPAVRRTVLALQAEAEAARVVAYRTAMWLDEADHHPDADRRSRAEAITALLTPVVKAFLTDLGHRGADDAIGVFGGYGYVHETGIEQHARDSRISMIYEGTNEIQAVDLVMRKIVPDGGARLGVLLGELASEADRCDAHAELAPFAAALRDELQAVRDGCAALAAAAAQHPERPLAVAVDVLQGIGWALFAWAWALTARAALPGAAGDEVLAAKLARARYGVRWLLPQSALCWRRVHDAAAELPWIA